MRAGRGRNSKTKPAKAANLDAICASPHPKSATTSEGDWPRMYSIIRLM